METTRPHPVDQLLADRTAEADAFLETLRAEQMRFLDAIGRARSLLGGESGQLANVAAVHGRLTRQFFDAQRTIMTRRAELDAEVAAVGRAADERAAAQLAMARERVAAGRLTDDVADPADGSDPAPPRPSLGCESTRQQIAALGVSVVRTMDDVDALAKVINGAFELDEADGVASQRQLTALLDGWWQAEMQEGRAVIDDAHARAAVRQHVAGIEADELIRAARGESGAECQPDPSETGACAFLPREVADAFDGAPAGDLESLLAHLTDSLEVLAVTAPPDGVGSGAGDDASGDVIIRFDPAPSAPAASGSAEAFQHFWTHEPSPSVGRRASGWFPSHVVVPMTAATSLLALFFAWIG